MSDRNRIKNILKKGVSISGVIMRSLIGIGATALLLVSLKKKKKE